MRLLVPRKEWSAVYTPSFPSSTMTSEYDLQRLYLHRTPCASLQLVVVATDAALARGNYSRWRTFPWVTTQDERATWIQQYAKKALGVFAGA